MLDLWTCIGVLAALFALATGIAYHYSRRYFTTRPKAFAAQAAFAVDHKKGPSLSIVVPCYNEEERLPPMLKQTLEFCKEAVAECVDDAASRKLGLFSAFEIVVVDDCSKDGTAKVVEKFQADNKDQTIRLVRVNPNRGKGHAVRTGFFEATGDYVLMADGDNATQISDVKALFRSLRQPLTDAARHMRGKVPPVIAVGSRAHLQDKSMANRTFVRTVLMKLFHFVVDVTYFIGTRGTICQTRDTQCGFKLFDRRVCKPLFLSNRLERFAFDVELLVVANRCRYGVAEVPVRWEEIPGSKVNLRAMVQMGLECLLMCFTYGLGIWGVKRS